MYFHTDTEGNIFTVCAKTVRQRKCHTYNAAQLTIHILTSTISVQTQTNCQILQGHSRTEAGLQTLPPCFLCGSHCNSFVWAIWAGLGDVDPRQLRLCPRVTEVAGIVFPANSLFQGLQIRVYNDLGGLAQGLLLLPLTSTGLYICVCVCVCVWVGGEKEKEIERDDILGWNIVATP